MSVNALDQDDLDLERYCYKCQGFMSECKFCGGKGTIPTDFGQKILDFIKKYSEFTAPDRIGIKGDKYE